MVIRNSDQTLRVNSKSLEQFFKDCFNNCNNQDEIKKVSKTIRTIVDISAVDRMEDLKYSDPYDIY